MENKRGNIIIDRFKATPLPPFLRGDCCSIYCQLQPVYYEGTSIPYKLVSPSLLAIMAVPIESLVTLTTVRSISSGRSTASIAPIITITPGSVNPTACVTMKIVTKPALGIPAAPIEANKAVNTIINCWIKDSSNPNTWLIKITPAHSYNAVPSMFNVAPKGSTKLDTRLDTPARFSTQSSVTGKVADDELVEKAVSKAGIIHLTRALAIEWARYNITVNAIAPSYMETPLTREWLSDPRRRDLIAKRSPLNRVGQPNDLTGAILLFASDESNFITGQTLFVDGGSGAGWVIRWDEKDA